MIAEGIDFEPWKISLVKRCSILHKYVQEKRKISVIIYEQADTSTFRYRAFNIFQAMDQNNEWGCMFFFLNELDVVERNIKYVDLLIISRVRWFIELDKFLHTYKKTGKKIIFDVDDLVFDLNKIPVLGNTLNVGFKDEADYNYWFTYIGRLQYTASLADAFITTNDYLGDKLQKKFHKPYAIIRNFLNRQQKQASEECLLHANDHKGFRIGYFSGTPSHINDFRVVYHEIMALLEKYSDIFLDVVGFMEFPEEAKKYIDSGRITFTSLVDFVKLQTLIANVDVNIVPLVNNIFTNCKSELKYFEAGIVNVITCATPTFTYKECINDGINGFLCKNGEWYKRIEAIYLNNVDLEKIKKSAYNDSYNKYYGDNTTKMIIQAYEKLMNE